MDLRKSGHWLILGIGVALVLFSTEEKNLEFYKIALLLCGVVFMAGWSVLYIRVIRPELPAVPDEQPVLPKADTTFIDAVLETHPFVHLQTYRLLATIDMAGDWYSEEEFRKTAPNNAPINRAQLVVDLVKIGWIKRSRDLLRIQSTDTGMKVYEWMHQQLDGHGPEWFDTHLLPDDATITRLRQDVADGDN